MKRRGFVVELNDAPRVAAENHVKMFVSSKMINKILNLTISDGYIPSVCKHGLNSRSIYGVEQQVY